MVETIFQVTAEWNVGTCVKAKLRWIGEISTGISAVDVRSIGAGGGSIAWIDDGGALRVRLLLVGAVLVRLLLLRAVFVRLLLARGLDPDDRHQLRQYESKPYSWGEPLAQAAGNAQYACAELLLERGADPNASIYASGNPVSAAYYNADERMKGLLFRHGGILDPIPAGLEGETSAAAVALHK